MDHETARILAERLHFLKQANRLHGLRIHAAEQADILTAALQHHALQRATVDLNGEPLLILIILRFDADPELARGDSDLDARG